MEEQHYTETPISLNSCLCWNHPTRKMSEMLLLCYNTRQHTSVCTTQAITNFRWTGLPHPPYGPDLAPSDYYLCWSPERKKKEKRWWGGGEAGQDTIISQWRDTAECHGPMAAEEQLLSGGKTCSCSKVEEDCRQSWRLHWKITAWSNVVVKFYEIFTCPNCKWHEIKRKRCYFLTAPCV
jgi:hypothetical protein